MTLLNILKDVLQGNIEYSLLLLIFEFLKYFSWTYICKIEENFLYRSLKSKEFFNNENKKNNDKYYIDNLGNVNFEKLNINNDNDNDKSKSKSKTEGENYNCNFF
jgi:hypothetical protein